MCVCVCVCVWVCVKKVSYWSNLKFLLTNNFDKCQHIHVHNFFTRSRPGFSPGPSFYWMKLKCSISSSIEIETHAHATAGKVLK